MLWGWKRDLTWQYPDFCFTLALLTLKSLLFAGVHSVIITCLIPLGDCKITCILLTVMLNNRGTTWGLRKVMATLERKSLRIQTVTMFNNHDLRNVMRRVRNFGVIYKQLFSALTLHCEQLYWFDWKCQKYVWSCRKAKMSAGKALVCGVTGLVKRLKLKVVCVIKRSWQWAVVWILVKSTDSSD